MALEDAAQRLGAAEPTARRDDVERVTGHLELARAASRRVRSTKRLGLSPTSAVKTRVKWRTLMAAAAASVGRRWSPPGADSTSVWTARTVERSARGTHTGEANWVWPPGRCRNMTSQRATVWATSAPRSSWTSASERSIPAVTPALDQYFPSRM